MKTDKLCRHYKNASKMLEDGINEGRYADILDTINVNIETPFFKAIVQFAEDYASQIQKVESLTGDQISKDTYPKEFIRWLSVCIASKEISLGLPVNYYYGNKEFSLDELYIFWQVNIKDK